jgi:XTP/dITP diphosphohydrolase
MNELILATSNLGKIREFEDLLKPLKCIPQTKLDIQEAQETGLSFIENAILKARNASLQGKKPALADDSGLVVPALGGEPGIFSARYAKKHASDADNMKLLLEKMKHLSGSQRKAYFYCAIALISHAQDPTPLIATGIFHGEISTSPSGEGGFGYDPIFFIPEHQCTAAALNPSIKNTISHRAQALNQLRVLSQNTHD